MADEEQGGRVFYEAQESTLKQVVAELEKLRDSLAGTDGQEGE